MGTLKKRDPTVKVTADVYSVRILISLCYFLRRRWFLKMISLVLSLWLFGILFVYFNQPQSTYMLFTSQTIETVGIKSPDRSVHIRTNQITPSSRAYENVSIVTKTEHLKLGQVNGASRSGVKDSCNFPQIDHFDPVVMALSTFKTPITCTGGVPHLVYLSGDNIKVNHSKTVLVGDNSSTFKECTYKSLARGPDSDFYTVFLYTSDPFNDSITLRENDDNLVVECYDSNNTVLSRSYFSLIRVKKGLEILLEENYKKHIATHSPKEVLSVLMIGIDGNSKQNFQRQMPKTRNYLLNVLNARELHKYNTAGGQTYPALVPVLTGKHWAELERHNWSSTKDYFDHVNEEFVWSDFRKAGYRTGFFMDDTYVTAFHYMKKGWNKPPVDYYHRATILEHQRDRLVTRKSKHCVGDIPEITFNNNFWIQMASTFNNSKTRPYFGLSFSQHLTHDNQDMASAGDDLYLHFLQELKDKNIINNTVIIFFSDHGERFGAVRSTYNGMIESRTPYVFLVFLPWFHRKYSDLMKVMTINQERLTTNTDLYETLRDLLNFQARSGLGDINKRGISLLQEIPRQRTCKHAGISLEYCICNHLTQTNVSSSMSVVLVIAVLDKLRRLIKEVRGNCERLAVKSIQDIMTIEPEDSADRDATEHNSLYQITVTTTPGDAIYEVKMSVSNTTKMVEVIGDVGAALA